MDLYKLTQQYHSVSWGEIKKIEAYEQFFEVSHDKREDKLERAVTNKVRHLHESREREKRKGKTSFLAGPLVQVLFVHLLPIDQNKSLIVHGRIYIEFRDAANGEKIIHYLYNRPTHDAQVLGPNGGTLALMSPIGPRGLDWPHDICMSLHNTRLVVNVFVGGEKLFIQQPCFAEDSTNLEQYVCGNLGSGVAYTLCYAAMPMAIYGQLRVEVSKKRENSDRQPLNVQGKIVARYRNTYSTSCTTNECTLFEKQGQNFERVEVAPVTRRADIRLDRSWVALPAYSSLDIDLDLSKFGTQRRILKEIVEFRVDYLNGGSSMFIIDDDTVIEVFVGWSSPIPQATSKSDEEVTSDDQSDDDEAMFEEDDQESKASDVEMTSLESDKEQSGDEEIDELCHREVLRGGPSWVLQGHGDRPWSRSAVQIFSVFIGREKFKPLQIYGTIILSSHIGKSDIFRRETKDHAFGLGEHDKTIPILGGCQAYNDSASVKMKVDLKDANSSLHIKGYVDWDLRGWRHWVWSNADYGRRWFNRQLCSVVQGEHGFAAIHYTMFEDAVQADVEVLCLPKNGKGLCSKIYGSLMARYNNHDYRSRYNKDYYKVVLFENSAEVGPEGLLVLSRCRVAVPVESLLSIEANFICDEGTRQVLTWSREFRIQAHVAEAMLECDFYDFRLRVKWNEFSN